MRKLIIYGILIISILINVYLIFIWNPKDFSIESQSQNVIASYDSVYTLDKDEIIKKLSDSDKSTLKEILEKLSTFDFESVKENLSKDNKESVQRAFMLMKRRLSVDDYKKVKEICSEFIKISDIENI